MTFNELPIKTQERLAQERAQLSKKRINTAYEVHLYNAEGTRYFYARRLTKSWNDDKGNYMPFGGGSFWRIAYGRVQFEGYRNPVGERDYRLCDGKTYARSANGTVIPRSVDTKKEVMTIAKNIGIFNF